MRSLSLRSSNPSKRYHAANAGITVKTRTRIVCKDASYMAGETGFSVGRGRPISPPPRYQKTIHAKVVVTHTTTVATPSIFNSRISLRVDIRRLTIQLTDRRALTCQSFKTPRHQSQAQTAVRWSDLVRRRCLIRSLRDVESPDTG